MNEPKHIHIERKGIRLHALDHGGKDKPVLLLVHGAAAHARWWDFIVPRLSAGFRPVAVDLRGHGDSSWADDYSYEAFAADLAAWIHWAEGEGGGAPALLGHSMGGVISLKLYEVDPPRIRGLVVVDAPLHLDERILNEVRSFGNRPSRPWISRELFAKKFRMIPSSGKADPSFIAYVASHSVRQLEDGTWLLKADRSFHANREGANLRTGWKHVDVPAMLIVGELSDRLMPADLKWLRQNLPKVRIEIIKGAHHHVYVDNPEMFLEIVRPFLQSLLS